MNLTFITNFLKISIFNNQLWQYGLFLIVVFLSMALAKLLDCFIVQKIKKITERTQTQIDDILVKTMKTPLKLVIIFLGIRLGTSIFYISENFEKGLNHVFEVLIAVIVTVTIIKTIDLFLDYLEPKVKASESKLDDQLLPIIRKTIKIFVAIAAVIVIIQNLGYNVVSILTGLGIGGLALAAQETLSNFFGSSSLNIFIIHWCKYLVYEEFLKANEEINLEIMKRFELEGIEIAFPTQTIYLKQRQSKTV